MANTGFPKIANAGFTHMKPNLCPSVFIVSRVAGLSVRMASPTSAKQRGISSARLLSKRAGVLSLSRQKINVSLNQMLMKRLHCYGDIRRKGEVNHDAPAS
jgi:hypothetical protein